MRIFQRNTCFLCNCQRNEGLTIILNAVAGTHSSFVLKSINGNEIHLKARNPSPFARDSFQPEIQIRILEVSSGSYLHTSFSLQKSVRIGLLVFYGIAFFLEFLLIVCALSSELTEPWLALIFPVPWAAFLCMGLICFRKNTRDAISNLTALFL